MNKTVIEKCIKNENFLILSLLSGDINWEILSYVKLPFDFLCKNKQNIFWDLQSSYIDNKTCINEFKEYINWNIFCCTKYFKTIANFTFLKKYQNYIVWEKVVFQINFTDDILNEFFEELYTGDYIPLIFKYERGNKISCEYLDSISEYFDNKTWKYISKKKLDPWFIEKYSNQLNWILLSEYQIFSLSFMKNNINNIKWNWINAKSLEYQSKEFIKNEVLPRITNESRIHSLIYYHVVNREMLIGTKFQYLLKTNIFKYPM